MKARRHPVSTTSRPPMVLIAECRLTVERQDVDFLLTDSSATLNYLTNRLEPMVHPREHKARARIDERMGWVDTQPSRDFAHGTVPALTFPHHKRPDDEVQRFTVAWGRERAAGWIQVLAGPGA